MSRCSKTCTMCTCYELVSAFPPNSSSHRCELCWLHTHVFASSLPSCADTAESAACPVVLNTHVPALTQLSRAESAGPGGTSSRPPCLSPHAKLNAVLYASGTRTYPPRLGNHVRRERRAVQAARASVRLASGTMCGERGALLWAAHTCARLVSATMC